MLIRYVIKSSRTQNYLSIAKDGSTDWGDVGEATEFKSPSRAAFNVPAERFEAGDLIIETILVPKPVSAPRLKMAPAKKAPEPVSQPMVKKPPRRRS